MRPFFLFCFREILHGIYIHWLFTFSNNNFYLLTLFIYLPNEVSHTHFINVILKKNTCLRSTQVCVVLIRVFSECSTCNYR